MLSSQNTCCTHGYRSCDSDAAKGDNGHTQEAIICFVYDNGLMYVFLPYTHTHKEVHAKCVKGVIALSVYVW